MPHAETQRRRGNAEENKRYQLSAISVQPAVDEEGVDDHYGFDADARVRQAHHRDGPVDEADDVFFIIRIVGIAGDAAALARADLILVDDPIERAAVAEAIFDDLGRAYGECEHGIDLGKRGEGRFCREARFR